jgi:uncharacterized membrane-anchored protein YhcB (DUF1043 family)
MEFQDFIKSHFVWGLALGLLVAGFVLKNSIAARFRAKRDLKALKVELENLQSHLNTQMKITATGSDALSKEIEQLRTQNENLRVNLATIQAKPDKAELRQSRIVEIAISSMREQAPGFAGAWEKALRHAEGEMHSAESGFTKLIRKVTPSFSRNSSSETPVIENQNDLK